MAKVGFIGLGVMGYPMAGHLVAAGHDVTVFNRSARKADAWVEEYVGAGSASKAATPAEAATDAEVVVLILGDDDSVRSVVASQGGVLDGIPNGAVILDHTTTSASLAREMHALCGERGVGFVDAPVSGGEAGAQNGKLTIMCGGDQSQFDSAAPIADAYAVGVTRLGESGAGQTTKMVNQICIAGALQGLSEGIHLAMKAGLDVDQVVEVISKGAAGSWQMANRGSTMARGEFDFGFAVDHMRKDLGIALRGGEELDASLPVAALVDQLYKKIQARGGNRWDTSSLIDLLTNP